MKTNIKRRKGFTLVELLVVIAIIVSLAALSTPAILKQQKKAAMIQATSNARQIFAVMLDFDAEFGSFPSADTAESGGDDLTGFGVTDANDAFGQLIAAGFIDSEEIFFAKGGTDVNKKPDNVVGNPPTTDKTLEAGENGFAYLMLQGEEAMSTSDNSGRPIVVAPVEPDSSQTDLTFNPDPYDKKAVILRLDGSVKSERINRSASKVEVEGTSGKIGLLESGDDTVWGEDNVEAKLPRSR